MTERDRTGTAGSSGNSSTGHGGTERVAASQINREYRSTVFALLFSEKKNALALYNALHHTSCTDEEEIQVNTLEGSSVFARRQNDVSFLFAGQQSLYEHQSTVNPNMPLRNLFYLADLLQRDYGRRDLYRERVLKIPAPRFAVFYNGRREQPEEQTYRLSDQFESQMAYPEVELAVTVYNINPGMNEELKDRCRPLRDYTIFVERMQEALDAAGTEQEKNRAAREVIEQCIGEGILADFLRKYGEEIVRMYAWEITEEEYREVIREDAMEWAAELAEQKAAELAEQKAAELAEQKAAELAEQKAAELAAEREAGWKQEIARLQGILARNGIAYT